MTKSRASIRVFHFVLLLCAAAFYLFFILRTGFLVDGHRQFTLVDDAMVSMRYAQHLASGHGITWNIGEPPIQGYTNPGWMLYMAGLHLLSISSSMLSLLVMLTGLVILLLNIHIVKLIAEQMCPGNWPVSALSTCIVAFYFPLVFWTLRGMELGLQCLLVDTALLLCFRLMNDARWPTLIALAALILAALIVRIDASIQMSIIALFVAISSIKQKRWGRFALISTIAGAVFFLLLIYERIYFGSLAPNTFYLKVTGVTLMERMLSGAKYLISVTLGDIALPILIITGCLIFLGGRVFRPQSTLLICLFSAQVVYSLYVGGDFAENDLGGANRFITQGMPALILLMSTALIGIYQEIRNMLSLSSTPSNRRAMFMVSYVAVAIVLLISGDEWVQWCKHNAPMLDSDILRTRIGILIRKGTDGQARVAAHAAGQIPYYSERYTIDLLGKSDPVIAKGPPARSFIPGHNKWNYDYSIRQLKPDVVADEWGLLKDWMIKNGHGYVRLPNGIWVNASSNHIAIDSLSQSLEDSFRFPH